MSQYVGGFLVAGVNTSNAERLFACIETYVRSNGLSEEVYGIRVTVTADSPVAYIAFIGGQAEQKAFLYRDHAALGADIAKTLRRPVWAFGMEGQARSEFLAAFDSEGRKLEWQLADWDAFAKERNLTPADDAFWVALPLGELATKLNLSRDFLVYQLPDAEAFEVDFGTEKADLAELFEYLSGST